MFLRACAAVGMALLFMFGGLAPVLAGGVVASAETPAGALVQGGTLVLEASSSHLSIQLYWDDTQRQRTSFRYLTIVPLTADRDQILWRLLIGGGANVAKIAARGEAEASWEKTNGLPADGTPEDALQYSIAVAPEEIAPIQAAMNRLEADKSNRTLSGYARFGVTTLIDVVRAANFKQQVASDNVVELFPDPNQFGATPVSWLYGLMQLNSGGPGGQLEGCATRKFLSPADLDSGLLDRLGQALGNNMEQRASIGFFGFVRLYAGLPEYIANNDVAADLLPFLQFDPVMIDIYDCQMLQAMRGSDGFPDTIVGRSQIYRAFDDYLARTSKPEDGSVSPFPGGEAPKFFKAAYLVTRPLGVSFVDLLERQSAEVLDLVWKPLFGVGGALGIVNLAETPDLPSTSTRTALREINVALFELNRTIMRRLFARPGRIFDPLDTNNPAMAGYGKATAFDLRMVVAEQMTIERYLRDKRPGQQTIRQLTAYSRILPGLDVERVFRPDNGKKWEHLKQIRDVYAAVNATGIQPDFANFKYRVAIGSAYVLILHGVDPTTELKPYLDALWPTLRQRPTNTEARALDDRIRALRAAPDILLAADGGKSAPALLQRGVAAFLSPIAVVDDWLDCSAGDVLAHRAQPQGLASPEARRAFLAKFGPAAAIAAFELLPQGGAIDGAARPPTSLAPNACTAIHTRFVALQCALQATSADGCKAELAASVHTTKNDGSDAVFLFEESVAAKAFAAQLGPFFTAELAKSTPIESVVEEARIGANLYARKSAMFSALNAASERALANYGAGITAADLEAPRALFGPSTGKVGTEGDGGFSVDDAALAQLDSELSKSRLAATIDQRLAALTPILVKLDAYYDPNAPIVLQGLSDDPVASTATSTTEEIISLAPAAVAETVLKLESTLAEAGIELKVSPTGTSAAGLPLHDVSVYYRMPAGNGATACELTSATPCRGGSEELVPLGIEIHRVAKTADGGLQTTALAGEQDTDLNGSEANAALHRLGLPAIFAVHGLGFESSKDLNTLSLSFGFDVAGLSGSGLTLPIIEQGVAVDVRGALETAVRQKIEAFDIGASFEQLRLPAFGSKGKGMWLAPDPEGAKVSLDWPGQVLVANIGYRLGFGADDGGLMSAKAELLATGKGFEVRQLSFDGKGAEAFVTSLLDRSGLRDALKDKLDAISIDPEYTNAQLVLAVSGNFSVGSCKVAVVVRVPAGEFAADPARVVTRITTSGEQIANDVANCAVEKTLDGVVQLLEAKSLRLFGLTLAIDNADELTEEYALNPGLAELHPKLLLVDSRDCGDLAGPASGTITGAIIRLAAGTAKLDLSGIAKLESEAQLLGRAVECRLRSLVAPGGSLDVTDYQLSGETFSAAVTIRDLPWLGDISLGRINISALGTEDPEKILTDAVGAALEARVSDEVARRLTGKVAMPGIGDFELLAGGTKVSLFGPKAGIELKGRVDIQSIKATATLSIPFKGLPGSARVTMDVGQSLQDTILGVIGDLLPFGGDQVQVSAPRLERLDANGRRFGFVFGITANFAMDPSPGFKIEIKRIIITDQDIRLGGQIRLRLGYDLEFVYFAITDITVIYDTGEGGGQNGVILEASVAPFASALKYIIKLEGELDLRELGSKRFTLRSALILLNSLDLMFATGTIDLDQTSVTFDARTSPAVAEVLDIHGSGKFLGKEGIASADAVMGILGVKLSQTEMLACSKPCEDLPAPEMLRVRVSQNLLIGDANLLGTTDFELNDPRIGGRVDLDLFGWHPASATLDASLASVIASLRFIGIGVTVITPSIETMTPGLLSDILKNLLDIDLKSLLKLKLKDITVSLMHGNGSVTTTKPNAPNDPNGQMPGGNGASQAPDPGSTAPKPYTNTAPDPGAAAPKTEPQFPGVNERFGEASVEAIYCEKVFGTGASWPANDGDRFEFWVYEKRDAAARLYSGHTHPDPSKVTWHDWTFDAAAARVICDKGVNPVHELNWEKFPRVGVGRQISVQYGDCIDNVPSIGLWALVGEALRDKNKFVTSYKPVLCWQKGSELYDLRVRLLHNGEGYLGLVECTAPVVAPQWLENEPLFHRACRERSGLLDLGTLADVNDGLLTASQEFTLLDIRARHLLTTGQASFPEQKLSFQVPLSAGAIDVTVFPVFDRDGVEVGSRVLMQGPDGKTLTTTLTRDDPLSPWLALPGFQQEIISLWFEDGRHPVVDFSRTGTDLVLSSGGPQRLWLWRDDPAASPVGRRALVVAPEDLHGDPLPAFLEALAPEIRLLPEPDATWNTFIGIAPQSDIRLYVLGSGSGQVRILLDLYRQPAGPERPPGDYSATDRTTRRICQSSEALGAALKAGLGAAAEGLTADAILAAPDDLLKLGPPVHPLIIVRQQPACV
ncbi:hypothetical protein NKJ16_16855 [Mesorhizobium sp. M0179]|uniref:hypothetical protein n=1 Tax=Mesorhizobium sp. M0179 TaxID=2956905 RepID=UPI00333AECCD